MTYPFNAVLKWAPAEIGLSKTSVFYLDTPPPAAPPTSTLLPIGPLIVQGNLVKCKWGQTECNCCRVMITREN